MRFILLCSQFYFQLINYGGFPSGVVLSFSCCSDARLLTEIDKSGYIDKLYGGQVK